MAAVVVTQVISRSSLVTEAHQRNVCHFDGMHASHICENADLVCIHTGKNKFILCMGSLFVSLISILINKAHIAEAVHKEADLCLFHLLFFVNCLFCVLDHSSSLGAVFFFDSVKFFNNYFTHGIIVVQNIFIRSNIFHSLVILCLKCLNFQSDQTIQTHFQNGCSLILRKFQILCSFLTDF